MNRTYFGISLLFTLISVVAFGIGFQSGFANDVFNLIKPITIFQYSTFLAFAFVLNAFREEIRKNPWKDVLLVIGFFVAMATFYEVLFNFFYWFSLYNFYGLGSNLDSLRNVVSEQRITIFNVTNYFNLTTTQQLDKSGIYPTNLNLVSKYVVLFFFAAIYWIYFIHDLKNEKT